jgi:hypothetical protein
LLGGRKTAAKVVLALWRAMAATADAIEVRIDLDYKTFRIAMCDGLIRTKASGLLPETILA